MKCCCKKTSEDDSCPLPPAVPKKPDKQEQQNGERPCSNFMNLPYIWFPSIGRETSNDYVRKLEIEYACMQKSVLTMTTNLLRIQCRLRQLMQASPGEITKLVCDLERVALEGSIDPYRTEVDEEMPHLMEDLIAFGEVQSKQRGVVNALRNRVGDLEDALQNVDIDALVLEEPYFVAGLTDKCMRETTDVGCCRCFGIQAEPRIGGYEHEENKENNYSPTTK